MNSLKVGVIIGAAKAQREVNMHHGRDLTDALIHLGHTVRVYDFQDPDAAYNIQHDYQTGRLDLVFNNAAGKEGGDGSIEQILEVFKVPFVGSGSFATASAFNKQITKNLVAEAGVPLAPGFVVTKQAYSLEDVQKRAAILGYPLVTKAVCGSDSIGVSLVDGPEGIGLAMEIAFQEDDSVIVEQFIRRSADLTCFVLGTGATAQALLPAESIFDALIYTSDLAEETILRVPQVDPSIIKAIKRHSLQAHRALKCSDYSRSDFLVDEGGSIFFLELNAHAGLGRESCTSFIARQTYGWNYERFIQEIITRALDRQALTKAPGSPVKA